MTGRAHRLTAERTAALAEADAARSRASARRAELAGGLGGAGDLKHDRAPRPPAESLTRAAAVADLLADPDRVELTRQLGQRATMAAAGLCCMPP
jgi:hypothetical protein